MEERDIGMSRTRFTVFGTRRNHRDQQQPDAFSAAGANQPCDNFVMAGYDNTVTFMRSTNICAESVSKARALYGRLSFSVR